MVIRRADSTGPAAGLTAVYTGTRKGDRIGGEFTSSWPGHWDSKTENWYATVKKNPRDLPSAMRFCGPAHCGTLTWSDGHYDAVYDDEHGKTGYSTYTVKLFTSDAILINRVDKGTGTAVLTGRLSPEGNSVVDGKITFTGLDGTSVTNPYRLTWGSAFSAAGGTPTVQPQRLVVAAPVVCLPWFFGVICD